MKANVLKSTLVALFLFVTVGVFADPDPNATLYHNVKTLDNVISTTYFKGNGNTENLIPFKKKVKTMDENGVCISKVTYMFDMNSKSWSLQSKMNYNYDNGKLMSIEYFDWNKSKNNWSKPKKTSYTYDENNVSTM